MKPKFSTPTSVVVAGMLIASAVFFKPVDAPKKWDVDQNRERPVATTTAPQINITGVLDDDHIKGNENADVVLVVYSDLECPFCKTYHETVKKAYDAFKGRLAVVYRHYPIDQLHSKARAEANATECAYEQKGDDGFWKYVDEVFKVTPSNNKLDPQKLLDIAKKQGYNMVQFANCNASGKYASKVEAQFQSGIDAGAKGTPYSVLVTKSGSVYPVNGGAVPFETLKAAIDKLIQ